MKEEAQQQGRDRSETRKKIKLSNLLKDRTITFRDQDWLDERPIGKEAL